MKQKPLQPVNPVVVRGWNLWVPLPPSTGTPRNGKKPKPKWINENERENWHVRGAKTKLWRGAACLVAQESGIPCLERVWVQAYFSFGDRRRRDVANLYPTAKACVDGFTDAGLWVDDRDGIFTGPDPRRLLDDAKGHTPGISFMIWEVTE